jgi:hypothetical protein
MIEQSFSQAQAKAFHVSGKWLSGVKDYTISRINIFPLALRQEN